jgi:hypothetical protein
MKPLITILSLVILGAAADGLNFAGHGTIGHTLEAFEILGLMTLPVIIGLKRWKPLILFVVAYALIRFALFSYTFNIVAGLPWDYIGVVDPIDRLMGLFRAPAHGWVFAKSVFLVVGISIPLKYL